MTPDINILVAAFRADHVHHKVASNWLSEALAACDSGGSVSILPMIASGFVRLVTNPKIFLDPAPVKLAIGFIDALLEVPGVDMPAVGEEWLLFRKLCLERRLKANDVPDAWIASAVLQQHDHLVTFDKGFTRLLNKGQVTVLAT